MTKFQTKAVLFNLNRMFREPYFSICEVTKMMKVTGATRNSDYETLDMYHCTNYSEMDEETRNFIHKAVLSNVTNCYDFPRVGIYRKPQEPVRFAADERTTIERLMRRTKVVN